LSEPLCGGGGGVGAGLQDSGGPEPVLASVDPAAGLQPGGSRTWRLTR
jgi:hypothetical protein